MVNLVEKLGAREGFQVSEERVLADPGILIRSAENIYWRGTVLSGPRSIMIDEDSYEDSLVEFVNRYKVMSVNRRGDRNFFRRISGRTHGERILEISSVVRDLAKYFLLEDVFSGKRDDRVELMYMRLFPLRSSIDYEWHITQRVGSEGNKVGFKMDIDDLINTWDRDNSLSRDEHIVQIMRGLRLMDGVLGIIESR